MNPLPLELQTLVDQRLDATDQALLRAGTSRSERLAIIAELESQISELLSRQSTSENPTREELLAVLAQIDPPEAFAKAAESGAAQPASSAAPQPAAARTPLPPIIDLDRLFGNYCGVSVTSAAALGGALLLGLCAAASGAASGVGPALAMLAVGLAIAGTVGGWLGVHRVRNHPQLRGMRAAIFAASLLPILLSNLLLLVLFSVMWPALLIIMAVAAVVALDVYVMRSFYRWVMSRSSQPVASTASEAEVLA